MTMPVTLNVAQALVFAKTSSNPIIIQDSDANIAASADALVALGTQVVSLQGDGVIFDQALSAADFLSLSAKTYFNGSLEIFTALNDTAANIVGNAAALGSYAAGLIQFGTGLSISVNDTVANIATNATALQTLAASLAQDTFGSFNGNRNGISFSITDTAADVAANATALQTLAAGLALDTFSGGGYGLLNNNSLSLSIKDNAADVAANATTLQRLAASLDGDSYSGGYRLLANNNNRITLSITDTAAVSYTHLTLPTKRIV